MVTKKRQNKEAGYPTWCLRMPLRASLAGYFLRPALGGGPWLSRRMARSLFWPRDVADCLPLPAYSSAQACPRICIAPAHGSGPWLSGRMTRSPFWPWRLVGAFPLGHPAASGGFRSVFLRRPCMSAASRWRPPFGVLPLSISVIAPAERRSRMNLSHGVFHLPSMVLL